MGRGIHAGVRSRGYRKLGRRHAAATLSLLVVSCLAALQPALAQPAVASATPAAPAVQSAARSSAQSAVQDAGLHYSLQAQLEPQSRELEVHVKVTVPVAKTGQPIEFLLAAPLQILDTEPAVTRVASDTAAAFTGINGTSEAVTQSGRAVRYRLQLPADTRQFEIRYRGRVDFGFETPAQEYARGFSETAGTINPDGVYLAGSSLWYPYLGKELFTFDLAAKGPPGWQLISPGSGTAGDAQGAAQWRGKTPVDELHIVGGPLIRYAREAGSARAEVYLRKADPALAARYLESTARNLEMYRALIGPYPYDKFALVENFWETGYGMPSFTLLGPQIIRFPFILTSSYPHEVLHNWWGNGVFVDYDSGNWAEGLTAYHADHLYKEQQGQGAEYRRDTLKKYRNFVREARDFPLKDFRSRHSPATEAVGYGKALMVYHMLRRQVGDEAYVRGLQRFYREQRGKRAGFAELLRAHGAAAQRDLDELSTQWIDRAGAPRLRLLNVERVGERGVRGELQQIQSGDPYALEVPIAIRTASGIEMHAVKSASRSTRFEFTAATLPLSLEADPEFDLFRLLEARETAPSLGQMFGEPEVLAILPESASAGELAAYRRMIAFWGGGGAQQIRVVTDRALKRLPQEQSVWVFGRANLWRDRLFAADPSNGFAPDATSIRAGTETIPFTGHSAVIVRRHPLNESKAVTWVTLDPLAAAEGVARRLPHYGKYSWLAFKGAEATNTAKGEWPTADSPLKVDLRPKTERNAALPEGGYPRRAPLATLPQVADPQRLRAHVEWLADPEREGRGMGTTGLEQAADYIASAMKEQGLQPLAGTDADGYSHFFEFTPAGAAKSLRLRNVVGVLPGADPRFAGETVIVSAHYDHLGRSGPAVRMAEVGRVHPGADDNASGVAAMLELARIFAAGGPPPRSLVFVAFSGEEAGLQGSKSFVAKAPLALEGVRAVVNLDTVGRYSNGGLSALATDTASEWPHVFRGISFATGIPVKLVPGTAQGSDQQSFIERGIPGIQLNTGAHLDYHRPTDTADKVDIDGLVKVTLVARETLGYLLQRPTALTTTLVAVSSTPDASSLGASSLGGSSTTPVASERKVSFGLVPDYAHQGAGVLAESVVPESPAALAGLRAGDIVLTLDGKPIEGLAGFADLLRSYRVGDVVRTRILRGATELIVDVLLKER